MLEAWKMVLLMGGFLPFYLGKSESGPLYFLSVAQFAQVLNFVNL